LGATNAHDIGMGALNDVTEAAVVAGVLAAAGLSVLAFKRCIASNRSSLRAVAWGGGSLLILFVAATFAWNAWLHATLDNVVEGDVLRVLPPFPSDDFLAPGHSAKVATTSPHIVRHLHYAALGGERHWWLEVEPDSGRVTFVSGMFVCSALNWLIALVLLSAAVYVTASALDLLVRSLRHRRTATGSTMPHCSLSSDSDERM
jgi:hypothetical protein